jgi:protein SFI1
MRPKATTATTSLQVWQRAYVTHQNAASFAIHYHSALLSSRILFAWRLRLREKLKLAKQARIAERFLLMRRSWKSWKVRMEDAKLEKKLKLWEKAKLKIAFERKHYRGIITVYVDVSTSGWYHIAYRQNLHRWAEQTMRQRIALVG